MKKTIENLTILCLVSFIITLMCFAYKYMWFSTETIPPERIIVAIMGVFVFGMILAGLKGKL